MLDIPTSAPTVKTAEQDANAAAEHHLRIQPTSGWGQLKLGELWQHRELVYFMTWRDIKIRYKQTALGASWAIIQPLFTMLVFSIFLGKLAKVPSDGLPYPLFSYAALVPWTFFATGLVQSSNSLVGSATLIRKVYFPRLAIPLGTVFAGMVDFLIAFLVLLVMMGFYGHLPTSNIIYLPLFVVLSVMTSLGVGLWLSAMNVRYRDVRYMVPFLTQFWLFATPVAYPSNMLPEPWKTVYGLNPMAGVVEGFRWALLGVDTPPGPMVWVSAVVAVLLLISGVIYFTRTEKTFADVV
jgi:lipopolysaccharide transport system permease protein